MSEQSNHCIYIQGRQKNGEWRVMAPHVIDLRNSDGERCWDYKIISEAELLAHVEALRDGQVERKGTATDMDEFRAVRQWTETEVLS